MRAGNEQLGLGIYIDLRIVDLTICRDNGVVVTINRDIGILDLNLLATLQIGAQITTFVIDN